MKKYLLILSLASIALLPGCVPGCGRKKHTHQETPAESETLVFEGSTEHTERTSGPVQEEVSFLEDELK